MDAITVMRDVLDVLWENRAFLSPFLLLLAPKVPFLGHWLGKAWQEFTGAQGIRNDLAKRDTAETAWREGLGERMDAQDAALKHLDECFDKTRKQIVAHHTDNKRHLKPAPRTPKP